MLNPDLLGVSGDAGCGWSGEVACGAIIPPIAPGGTPTPTVTGGTPTPTPIPTPTPGGGPGWMDPGGPGAKFKQKQK